MVIDDSSSLLAALGAWGRHEARTRRGPSEATVNDALAVEYILHYRAVWIAPILAAQPTSVFASTLQPGDVPSLLLYRSGNVERWKREVQKDPDSDSCRWFKQLADGDDQLRGPIICVRPTNEDGPLFVFEGYHRVGAWSEHIARGRSYDLDGFLIRTLRAPL